MRDRTAKSLSGLHTRLYRLTGGLIGRRLVNNDMLLLTTVGHKTRNRHTTPLLFLRDGRRVVVIASWGGRPHHPHWYQNLLADPRATIQILGESLPVRARTASTAERAVWWPRIVAAYEGYAEYQSRTTRQIPVVFLEPATPSG